MSKLITNTIRHTGGSADNITLDNSQNVTIEGTATVDGTTTASAGLKVGSANQTKTQDGILIERNSSDGYGHITAGRSGGNNSGFIFHVAGGSGVTKKLLMDHDGTYKFFTQDGTTEKLRLQSGGGVSFNGDSASANALDDYEEGTFTPTLIAGNNGYRFQRGSYVKVGQMVHVTAFIEVSAACSSGNLGISGLPFTSSTVDSNAHQTIMGPCYSNRCSLGNNAVWYLAANSSTAYCYAIDSNASNGTTLLDANNLSQANASAIMLSGTYRTT